MSGGQPSVFCPANTWTKVLYTSLIFGQHFGSFDVSAVTIEWSRYSTLPPFNTSGTHDTRYAFGAVVAGTYTDFWFRSPVALTVSWK
jgi:hypothetical protein